MYITSSDHTTGLWNMDMVKDAGVLVYSTLYSDIAVSVCDFRESGVDGVGLGRGSSVFHVS